MVRVLFVCMGNICRSPTAQGMFEYLLEKEGMSGKIGVDSAGTHAYHVGEPPDQRANSAAMRRGIDISQQRARKVSPSDFVQFDYVLAMDGDNFNLLAAICPPEHLQKLTLFLDYAKHLGGSEVPDPYYGGTNGFEQVLDFVEAASEGLLKDIKQSRKLAQ
ncbi:MAG: phosphotyrosine protein phosphatase [Gammaproteobacteria bacterium]|nr:MAG: phosphotyrosine protein phosphatase [Gammaproteobacteria bacterium]